MLVYFPFSFLSLTKVCFVSVFGEVRSRECLFNFFVQFMCVVIYEKNVYEF